MKSSNNRKVVFTFVEMADALVIRAKDFGFILPNDYTFKCDNDSQTVSFAWDEDTDHG